MFTEGLLCQLILDWFDNISSHDHNAAWELMASDHLIFDKQYNREDFSRYLEAVHNVSLARKTDKEGDEASQETGGEPWAELATTLRY